MKIYGIDFTSAPSRQKPITCVISELEGDRLSVDRYQKIASLNEFEVFLKRRGPWVAGFDFPFGQPGRLIQNLSWPETWEAYVGEVATMDQQEFEQMLNRYRQSRPAGDKQHLRATDIKAKALSPMMLYGVPVGKMFFRGAPRLLRAGVCVLPCRPTDDDRIALEAYPALVARKWLGKRSYKNDDRKKQSADQEAARRELLEWLCSPELYTHYGLRLELGKDLAEHFIKDPMADNLDALLCAIQAAWAYTKKDEGYGIPAGCDITEGWIIDPDMM